METSEPITINISEFKESPEKAFKTAVNKKSVVHVKDGDEVAGVLMSKAQYEFARDEIESLYDVIDELTVSDDIANSDEKTYSVNGVGNEKFKGMKLDEDDEWD